ncbi:unnamed protein product [Camellia sinensis]
MAKYREAFAKRMAMAGLKPHHRIGELDSGLLNFTNRWADVDEQGYSYGFSAVVSMLSRLSLHRAASVFVELAFCGLFLSFAGCSFLFVVGYFVQDPYPLLDMVLEQYFVRFAVWCLCSMKMVEWR